MFFSARHIDVKLNQDYADFINNDSRNTLVICDGIGEFKDSGIVSKIVVDQFISKNYLSVETLVFDSELEKLKLNKIIGGTTFISAINEKNSKKIQIEYLGNGGVIHLHGDYRDNPNSDEPYRYGELMIPHISANGALTRHISHTSNKMELNSSSISLNLNYFNGDILLLFSDGISSLEDRVILKDGEGRYWRNENAAIQLILRELNSFLESNCDINSFDDALVEFNFNILKMLKANNYLEDDASLGIIITEETLFYYKGLAND